MTRKTLTAPFRAVGAGLKAFTMRWPGMRGLSWVWLPRTRFDYAREVGDPMASNLVVACVNWIARSFPEAPVMVVDELPDGTEKKVAGHPLPRKIEKPNRWYSGPLLWKATMVDWATSGNAYWLKARGRDDKVAEIWWAPSWTMEPRWPDDGSAFISHYEYKVDPVRDPARIEPRDVVHFRDGLDPDNPRKGLSQLRSLMRELFTDAEAANMTAALMRNLGVPGVVITPEGFNQIDTDSARQIKDDVKEFSGDKRGEAMVMTAPAKVHVLSFSPEQMNLAELRRIPEERVAAVLGISPMVIGFGAGLANSSFTNYETALTAAWNQNLIPTQRLMAADLEIQLLPDFQTGPNQDVAFDYTKVRALQPDMDKVFERQDRAVRGGWQTVAGAQRAVGLAPRPEDEVFLRPVTVMAVPVGTPMAEQTPMMGQAPKELKQADPMASFVQLIALARTRAAEAHGAAVETFFKEQSERVRARMLALFNVRGRNGNGRKHAVFGAKTLLPADEDEQLAEALRPLWLASMESAWEIAAEVFNFEARFDAQSAPVAVALSNAFHRARRINDGTRAALASAIDEGERRGYSIQQLVDGVPEDEFRGLGEVAESHYKGRPGTVAATEAMWATNMGTSAAYRGNNIARVQMVDGGDDPACAARNGLVVSVAAGEAATNGEHPHGTLTLMPAR